MEEPTAIYTDGASRGNPGKAAWAFNVPELNVIASGLLPDENRTSFEAEYAALFKAIIWAVQEKKFNLTIHSDNKVMVNQMSNQCRTKDPKLIEMKAAIESYISTYRINAKFIHVPRDHPHIFTTDIRCNWELDHAKAMDDKQMTLGTPVEPTLAEKLSQAAALSFIKAGGQTDAPAVPAKPKRVKVPVGDF